MNCHHWFDLKYRTHPRFQYSVLWTVNSSYLTSMYNCSLLASCNIWQVSVKSKKYLLQTNLSLSQQVATWMYYVGGLPQPCQTPHKMIFLQWNLYEKGVSKNQQSTSLTLLTWFFQGLL